MGGFLPVGSLVVGREKAPVVFLIYDNTSKVIRCLISKPASLSKPMLSRSATLPTCDCEEKASFDKARLGRRHSLGQGKSTQRARCIFR